jgi:Zn-dependent metalloprotease
MKRTCILSAALLAWLLPARLGAQTGDAFAAKQKTAAAPAAPLQTGFDMQPAPGRPAAPAAQQDYPAIAFHRPAPAGSTLTEVRYGASQLPIFIRSQAPQGKPQPGTEQGAALAFLTEVKEMLRIQDPAQEFEVKLQESDALGHSRVKFQQVYQGVPVYGAELIVHFTPAGERIVMGRHQPTPLLPAAQPGLGQESAIALAQADMGARRSLRELSETWKQILGYAQVPTELIVYGPEGLTPRLAWHITLRPNIVERWEYFVDAQSGAILHQYDHTCAIGPTTGTSQDLNGVTRTLNLFETNNGFYMLDAGRPMFSGSTTSLPQNGSGFILTGDANNSTTQNPNFTYVISNNRNSWPAKAVSAHHNSALSYEYFRTKFNRNSINGQGGDVYAFINVAEDGGGAMDNAFWNGAAMFYGNGAQAFRPLAGSLDVGGHEMSHGVVQETANLEYQGQSGALNESFADIFGVMIDRDDWLLGEDVVLTTVFPSGALRSMSDPHNGGNSLNDNGFQPRHMNEIYTGTQDNGGVHINSGIVNWAFYKFATATSKDIAEQVYYRALSVYLTRSSQFIDARLAVVQAATDLHGASSNVVAAAKTAFDQVGITDGSAPGGGTGGQNYQFQLPVNPGPDFIVSSDVNNSDPVKLYISSTTGTNFQPLSNTRAYNKISVQDNGQVGYFVGTDRHIHRVNMNSANPQEQIISSVAEWDNVAISKDGLRLAAVSRFADTAIYVFNLASGQGVKYTLYNPTTASGGINTGGVLYADAIEWDYSGEYIMYDSYNEIVNPLGNDLQYWDVGFLRAWNKAGNTFGDGLITKLFTNLPEGISVGNAVFSKNSPSVIAFDFIDSNTGDLNILGANIETGDVGTVFENLVLGYPNYSKLDDKIIFNAQSTNGDSIVAVVPLAADKINSGGNAAGLIGAAKWGVWYTQGTRNTNVGIAEDLLSEAGLRCVPNPFSEGLALQLELLRPAEVSVRLLDLTGRELRLLQPLQTLGAGEQRLRLEPGALPAGLYLLAVELEGDVSYVKAVKR